MNNLPFSGILLVSDMDGTLLDCESRLSEENKKAIRYFVEGGGMFTVATGRMEKSVRACTEDLPINVPVILYNGAVICDLNKGNILYTFYLPENIKDLLRNVYNNFPSVAIMAYSDKDTYCLRQNEIMQNFGVKEENTSIITQFEYLPETLIKVTFVGENHELKRLEAYIKDKAPFVNSVFTGRRFFEIIEKNTSKGNALKYLIKMLNISQTKVVAMGDNMNDYEMLKVAGIGIAVENACSELKKVAAFCCPHHNDSPISKVIEWIEDERLFKKGWVPA